MNYLYGRNCKAIPTSGEGYKLFLKRKEEICSFFFCDNYIKNGNVIKWLDHFYRSPNQCGFCFFRDKPDEIFLKEMLDKYHPDREEYRKRETSIFLMKIQYEKSVGECEDKMALAKIIILSDEVEEINF